MRVIDDTLLQAWMAEQTIPAQPGPHAIFQIRKIFGQYRAAAVMAGSRARQTKGVDGMLRLARRMANQKTIALSTSEDAMGFFAEAFILALDAKRQQEAAEGYRQSLDEALVKEGRRDLFFEKVSSFYLKTLAERIGVTASQVAADRQKAGAIFYDCLASVLVEAYAAQPSDPSKRLVFVEKIAQLKTSDLAGVVARVPDFLPQFVKAQKEEAHMQAISARYDMMSTVVPPFQTPMHVFEKMIFLSRYPEMAEHQTRLLCGGVWGPYGMGQVIADHYASSPVPPAAFCTMAKLYETSAVWALRENLVNAPLFGLLCQKAMDLAEKMIVAAPLPEAKPRSRITRKAYQNAVDCGHRFKEKVLAWQNQPQVALG